MKVDLEKQSRGSQPLYKESHAALDKFFLNNIYILIYIFIDRTLWCANSSKCWMKRCSGKKMKCPDDKIKTVVEEGVGERVG